MAVVFRRMSFGFARTHRLHGLGALKSLNLAFFVNAQHEGVFGRARVKAHHIPDLVDLVGIGGDLEARYSSEVVRDLHGVVTRRIFEIVRIFSCHVGKESKGKVIWFMAKDTFSYRFVCDHRFCGIACPLA